MHLLSRPEDERERRSQAALAPLEALGVELRTCANPPYEGRPPAEGCRRPEAVVDAGGLVDGQRQLGPGHYGCFMAHRQAVEHYLTEDLDALVICECDCLPTLPPRAFYRALQEACAWAADSGVAYLSMGPGGAADRPEPFTLVPRIYQTHCVLFPGWIRPYLTLAFERHPWDTIDYWYNSVFWRHRCAVRARPAAVQAPGWSLLDLRVKHTPGGG